MAVWIGKVADPWTNLNKTWHFSNMTSSFIWTNENIFIYQLFCQQLIWWQEATLSSHHWNRMFEPLQLLANHLWGAKLWTFQQQLFSSHAASHTETSHRWRQAPCSHIYRKWMFFSSSCTCRLGVADNAQRGVVGQPETHFSSLTPGPVYIMRFDARLWNQDSLAHANSSGSSSALLHLIKEELIMLSLTNAGRPDGAGGLLVVIPPPTHTPPQSGVGGGVGSISFVNFFFASCSFSPLLFEMLVRPLACWECVSGARLNHRCCGASVLFTCDSEDITSVTSYPTASNWNPTNVVVAFPAIISHFYRQQPQTKASALFQLAFSPQKNHHALTITCLLPLITWPPSSVFVLHSGQTWHNVQNETDFICQEIFVPAYASTWSASSSSHSDTERCWHQSRTGLPSLLRAAVDVLEAFRQVSGNTRHRPPAVGGWLGWLSVPPVHSSCVSIHYKTAQIKIMKRNCFKGNTLRRFFRHIKTLFVTSCESCDEQPDVTAGSTTALTAS